MLSKRLRVFTAMAAVGLLVLAGCGAGGGGGGGGGDDESGIPTLAGNHYVLTIDNPVEQVDVTLGTTEWLTVNRQTQVWMRGPVTKLSSGVLKMVKAEISDPNESGPDVLYGLEVPGGFLFLLEASDLVADGGYADMYPAINQEGTCASISTQGEYNLVKTGQEEFSQVTGRAFGTATFTSAAGGLDLVGETRKISEHLDTGTPVSLGTIPTLACTGGMVGTGDDTFVFTASGLGLYRRVEGADSLDFVTSPMPATPIQVSALVGSSVRYTGMYQQMVDMGIAGMHEQSFYVTATGDGIDSITVDSYTDIEAGTLSGQPGKLTPHVPELRNGMFDYATFTFNAITTPAAGAAQRVGGKLVLTFIGGHDSNGNAYVDEPWDWFFMILMEQ